MASSKECRSRHGLHTRSLGLDTLGAGLLACVACAQAAGAPDGLTEADFLGDVPVVLTASRLSQPLGQAPAAVTIIDRDMIRASGFRDIPDLFRLVPGFTVAYTRENTWGVGYHGMADAFSRRMQVLIDGRSVYTPGFGEVPWTSLPLSIDDIERIEVVRGPNSAAYGSNAFFGVINIITMTADQAAGANVSGQYGQQGMRGASFRYGGGSDALRYRLTLSEQKRDRFASQPDKTDTRLLDFRADYQLSNTDDITADVALSRADWIIGEASFVRTPDVGADHFQLRFHRVVSPDTDWSLQFYHIRNRQEEPLQIPTIGLLDIGNKQTRDDLEFQMTTRPTSSTRLVWGTEGRWESAESALYFNFGDARTGALYRLFGNLEWRPSSRWTVNGGVMAEHHYLSGLDLSPRLALNYELAPDHALRASISQAYRSPTFFEDQGEVNNPILVFILGHGFAPGIDLQSERIVSREIGYVGNIRRLRLQIDARLFNDRVSKIIGNQQINPAPPPEVFQAFNLNHADIRGADIQARWKPERWMDLVLSYARVSISSIDIAKKPPNDRDIMDSAPKNNFSGLAIFKLSDSWEASVGLYRVGSMKWMDEGDITRAYTRIDARVAKQLSLGGHQAELALVGQNLGADYAEFRNDNTFDRRVYGSISLSW
ncbi:MAG: TonB-dependent receptor [Thiobacillaceae bacterium]